MVQSSKQMQIKLDKILAIFALLTIIGAWIVGASKEEAEIIPFLHQAFPEADRIELLHDGTYGAYDYQNKPLGYLAVGLGNGYGGVLKLAVAMDILGNELGGRSISQVALAWLLSDPLITSPIIGPRTLDQLDDNLGAVGLRLTTEEKEILDNASSWEGK